MGIFQSCDKWKQEKHPTTEIFTFAKKTTMKYITVFLFALILALGCNQSETNNSTTSSGQTSSAATPDLDDPKLANLQQASQMMNSILAKKTTLNMLVKEELNSKKGDATFLLRIGKPLENIRPMIERFESVIKDLEAGKKVDFLSSQDREKINYRKQDVAEALVDSLAYISSLLDQVLDNVTNPTK